MGAHPGYRRRRAGTNSLASAAVSVLQQGGAPGKTGDCPTSASLPRSPRLIFGRVEK